MTGCDEVKLFYSFTVSNRSTMKMIIFLIAACTTFSSWSQALKENVQPIKDVNLVYTTAVEKGDTVVLKKIFADNFVITSGNGSTRNRKDEIADLVSPGYTIHFFKIENEKYQVYDQAAVVTGNLVWKMTNPSGQEMNMKRVVTIVYSKFGKEWKIIAQHVGRT